MKADRGFVGQPCELAIHRSDDGRISGDTAYRRESFMTRRKSWSLRHLVNRTSPRLSHLGTGGVDCEHRPFACLQSFARKHWNNLGKNEGMCRVDLMILNLKTRRTTKNSKAYN
jgi:hypothetical protein